jgi:hypothetical protein
MLAGELDAATVPDLDEAARARRSRRLPFILLGGLALDLGRPTMDRPAAPFGPGEGGLTLELPDARAPEVAARRTFVVPDGQRLLATTKSLHRSVACASDIRIDGPPNDGGRSCSRDNGSRAPGAPVANPQPLPRGTSSDVASPKLGAGQGIPGGSLR